MSAAPKPKHSKLPKALRWAILKRADGRLTKAQAGARRTPGVSSPHRHRLKEMLRWIRKPTARSSRRRARDGAQARSAASSARAPWFWHQGVTWCSGHSIVTSASVHDMPPIKNGRRLWTRQSERQYPSCFLIIVTGSPDMIQ